MHAQLKHEAKRYASEAVMINGQAKTVRGGVLPHGAPMLEGLHPQGCIAYASVYAQGAPAIEHTERWWCVEYRKRTLIGKVRGVKYFSDKWLPATKSMQGRTFERAVAIVRAAPGYRLTRLVRGKWEPVKV